MWYHCWADVDWRKEMGKMKKKIFFLFVVACVSEEKCFLRFVPKLKYISENDGIKKFQKNEIDICTRLRILNSYFFHILWGFWEIFSNFLFFFSSHIVWNGKKISRAEDLHMIFEFIDQNYYIHIYIIFHIQIIIYIQNFEIGYHLLFLFFILWKQYQFFFHSGQFLCLVGVPRSCYPGVLERNLITYFSSLLPLPCLPSGPPG